MTDPIDALAVSALHSTEAKAALITQLTPLLNGTVNRAFRLRPIHGIIKREDLYQQATYFLLYLIPLYDPSRGSALVFFTIRLKVKISQYITRELKTQIVPVPIMPSNLSVVAPPDDIDLGLEYNTQRALDALSPYQRTVVKLAYLHDMTDIQIAELLGRGLVPIRQQRYRALRHMRKLL